MRSSYFHFSIATLIAIQTLVLTQGKPRIIGGEKAPEDEYKWFYNGGGCGASLIAPDMLLTAAHCSELFSDDLLYTRYIHPSYEEEELYLSHDFMVVKLEVGIPDVTPVPLDDGSISSTYDSDKVLWTLGM